MKKIKTLFVFIILLTFSYTLSAQLPFVNPYGLNIKYGRIIRKCGGPIELRGMSYFWHQWEGTDKYMNKDVMKTLKNDWKAQIVRIPIAVEKPGGYIENPTFAKNTAYKAIQAAIDNDMYVIIDWHTHSDDYLNQAKDFFRDISKKFGHKPHLIYEIFNEPIKESWAEIKTYAKEVIAVIRENDPNNIIVVGTPLYSSKANEAVDNPIRTDANGYPVSNIAYTLHFYSGYAPHNKLRSHLKYASDKGVCLFVTECGSTNNLAQGEHNYVEWQKWVDEMNKYNVSWCKWSLGNKPYPETASTITKKAPTNGQWGLSRAFYTKAGWHIREQLRRMNDTKGRNCTYAEIKIKANGYTGEEIMNLVIDGEYVKSWKVSKKSKIYKYFVFVGSREIIIKYDNDKYAPPIDRNLKVEYLEVCGKKFYTKDSDVAKIPANPGPKDELWTNGKYYFGTKRCLTRMPMRIYAKGASGKEIMKLEVDGKIVRTWKNIRTTGVVVYHEVSVNAKKIRVHFTNPGIANNVNKALTVDKIIYETPTNRSVKLEAERQPINTGGNAYSERMWKKGYIEFSNLPKKSAWVLEPENKDKFLVYPNPVQDNLFIKGIGVYDVSLYDVRGNMLRKVMHVSDDANIDITDITPGLYILKIEGENNTQTDKIIVK